MDQTQFLEAVSEQIDGDDDAPIDVTRAVLSTTGERLSADQARDLAAQLPGELASPLTEGESDRRFSEAEFLARVEQRRENESVSGQQAATSVIGVVLEHVDPSERAAVVDQFEHIGFEELLAETNAEVDVRDRSPR